MNENCQIELIDSFNLGRLLIAKNKNSTDVRIFDFDLMEEMESIETGKGHIYCNLDGDFVCKLESGILQVWRIDNGSMHGELTINQKSKVHNIFTSSGHLIITILNFKSPIIVNLKSMELTCLEYYTSFACISKDEKVIVIHSANSLFYHNFLTLDLIDCITEINEIPEKIHFFNHNLDMIVLLKDTKQVVHIKLNLTRNFYKIRFIVQDQDVLDLKMSTDESFLLICSLKCLYVYNTSNQSDNISLRFKILSKEAIPKNLIQEQNSEIPIFSGFTITGDNKFIIVTISTYLVCYKSLDGSIISISPSGLTPSYIYHTYTNPSSTLIVSLLSHGNLLTWNLKKLGLENDLELEQKVQFHDTKILDFQIDECLLPQVEHNISSNLNLALAYNKSYPRLKILNLKKGLRIQSIIDLVPSIVIEKEISSNIKKEKEDTLSFEIIQSEMNDSGRFCYIEYDLEEYTGKIKPEEKDFVKKISLIIDLAKNNYQIHLFEYVVRKKSSFRIKKKFIIEAGKTFLLIKVSCSIHDFDCFISEKIDWLQFESKIQVYGPLEELKESGGGGLKPIYDIKLSGESIESDLCITSQNVFASLMHKYCSKFKESSESFDPDRYTTHLTIFKFFDQDQCEKAQLFSLEEFLSDYEIGTSQEINNYAFLDMRLVSNENVLLIYSNEGVNRKKIEYNYEKFKFKRISTKRKGALVYNPKKHVILRHILSFLPDEINIEKVLFANFLIFDENWNLYDYRNDHCESFVNNEIKSLDINRKNAKFLLDANYLLTCSKDCTEISIFRTQNMQKVASFPFINRISIVCVGEKDRTILVGTNAGCLIELKLVIDLEQSVSLSKFVRFYRDESDKNDEPKVILDLENTNFEITIVSKVENNESNDEKFFSHFDSSKLITFVNPNKKQLHLGMTKTNLAVIAKGANALKIQSRACIIQ